MKGGAEFEPEEKGPKGGRPLALSRILDQGSTVPVTMDLQSVAEVIVADLQRKSHLSLV